LVVVVWMGVGGMVVMVSVGGDGGGGWLLPDTKTFEFVVCGLGIVESSCVLLVWELAVVVMRMVVVVRVAMVVLRVVVMVLLFVVMVAMAVMLVLMLVRVVVVEVMVVVVVQGVMGGGVWGARPGGGGGEQCIVMLVKDPGSGEGKDPEVALPVSRHSATWRTGACLCDCGAIMARILKPRMMVMMVAW